MPDPRIIEAGLRYEIVRPIAQGGMGIVYEALQHGARGFVKRVAIKIIRNEFAREEAFLENFIGEAKLVADLIHTNIVQTYQLGETGGVCFIAMEFLRGVNLDEFVRGLFRQRRDLPPELAVFIVSRIARGLAYAHAKTGTDGHSLGLVHRDVSPKNIMIAFEGDVKLTDFGIAKARGFLQHREGEVAAGKADYMSPEQAAFEVTDHRSDIFSAGVVLAYLLLGHNVFSADSPELARQRILELAIPDFQKLDVRIDERLNGILQRALARDRALRYPSADQFLHDLEYAIYHRGYGPTNETLGRFLRELLPAAAVGPAPSFVGGDSLLQETIRLKRRD